jgi:hypothetical protein
MPNSYPLYHATGQISDQPLTQLCPSVVPDRAWRDYAVNTIQPTSSNPMKLPPQSGTTIGDELSAKGRQLGVVLGRLVERRRRRGRRAGRTATGPNCSDPDSFPNPAFPYCPNKVFQFHHQPLNYYASFAPVRLGGRTCATRRSSSSACGTRGTTGSSTCSARSTGAAARRTRWSS